MRLRLALILPLLLMLAGSSLAQKKEHGVPDELSSSIPLLADFHEVIYPLWHDAWPNKKYDLIKELWPKVEDYSAKIAALQLPGILRDKKGKWDAGVKDLTAVTAKLKTAITANDEKGMLDNVEVLHSTYEKLVRVIRPRLKELEAYHVVLYQVYHYYMPEKNVAKLRKASKELAAASAKLLKVETPKKVASKSEMFMDGVVALHESTLKLQKIAAGKDVDAMATAVEDVHTKYQSVDAMFE